MPENLTDMLHQALASGRPIEDVPEALVPSDAAGAYRVQSELAAKIGPAIGWKGRAQKLRRPDHAGAALRVPTLSVRHQLSQRRLPAVADRGGADFPHRARP